ncbi:hypothetical protein [Paraburkholderia sp. ZP32-5]|uniref:hypothetical protein n=1 Tax=Paraburkholderia sp. ZP32-5 TaxID=2883245 RepID=UPI001F3993FD|nr:hypothetical protein [Paraburkholderia sp. ZP32-5]
MKHDSTSYRAFWKKRSDIFLKASRNPAIVSRAVQAVSRSTVDARLNGGTPLDFTQALIEAYLRDFHERFAGGRSAEAVGPIRKAIRRMLARVPGLSTEALWDVLKENPPRGWRFLENRAGKYIEGPKPGQNTDYRSFANACTKERKRLKITG